MYNWLSGECWCRIAGGTVVLGVILNPSLVPISSLSLGWPFVFINRKHTAKEELPPAGMTPQQLWLSKQRRLEKVDELKFAVGNWVFKQLIIRETLLPRLGSVLPRPSISPSRRFTVLCLSASPSSCGSYWEGGRYSTVIVQCSAKQIIPDLTRSRLKTIPQVSICPISNSSSLGIVHFPVFDCQAWIAVSAYFPQIFPHW